MTTELRNDPEVEELYTVTIPHARVVRTTYLGVAPAHIIGMAFGLFMIAAPMMGWIDFESPSLGAAFGLGGLCEYIMGFFDWYKGRSVQSFVDFVFGLLHWAIFLTPLLGIFGVDLPKEYTTYMQGTFFVIWFVMLLFLIIAAKDKGILYLVNFALLALGVIFTCIWEYSKRIWSRKLAGYFIFFSSITLWITALCKALYANLKVPMNGVVIPSI